MMLHLFKSGKRQLLLTALLREQDAYPLQIIELIHVLLYCARRHPGSNDRGRGDNRGRGGRRGEDAKLLHRTVGDEGRCKRMLVRLFDVGRVASTGSFLAINAR